MTVTLTEQEVAELHELLTEQRAELDAVRAALPRHWHSGAKLADRVKAMTDARERANEERYRLARAPQPQPEERRLLNAVLHSIPSDFGNGGIVFRKADEAPALVRQLAQRWKAQRNQLKQVKANNDRLQAELAKALSNDRTDSHTIVMQQDRIADLERLAHGRWAYIQQLEASIAAGTEDMCSVRVAAMRAIHGPRYTHDSRSTVELVKHLAAQAILDEPEPTEEYEMVGTFVDPQADVNDKLGATKHTVLYRKVEP